MTTNPIAGAKTMDIEMECPTCGTLCVHGGEDDWTPVELLSASKPAAIDGQEAVAWTVEWPGDANETWHSVFINERDALQSASNHADAKVTPLYAAPQQSQPAEGGKTVAWERLGVAWLRGRAAAQGQNNERWPEHAKAYDRWRYYVTIAQALADELEGNGLRPRDTLDPSAQTAQSAVVLDDERGAFDEATEIKSLREWVRQKHEPRMGKDWPCVLYGVNHGNEIKGAWLERARRATSPQPVAQTERALTDDARDAARYRFARDNIKLDHELPGAFYLGHSGKSWDKTIDAAMTAAQSANGGTHD